MPGDRALVKCGGPVENLDRRGDGHQIAEERKRKRSVSGFAGNKHVVRPDEKTDDRDGDAGTRDEGVSENGFARESGDNFANHAHGGKNHDVHGGMRIEPEEVLKEDGVATEGGIEKAQMKHALEAGEQESDGDNGRAQNHDQAGGVCAQANRGSRNQVMPGARMVWMVTMKLRPVRIEEKPLIKMPMTAGVTAEFE